MENISVSVRVRPLNRQETQEFFAWRVDGNSILQLDPNTRDADRTRDTKYALDHVFGPEWTTRQIYEVTTQSLIQKVVSGFNSTVFAYGQTSSGKTHTMRGSSDSAGIIPLAVDEAFRLIESSVEREYLIRVSYMELYNEDINDLLAPSSIKLPIHESKEDGPYVCGLREDIVTSAEQVLALLESGEANRHIGSTKMNEKSSRSHTIFRMVVESRAVDAESDDAGAVLVSVLTLVDLAGSERVAKTGAEGIRMKEGTAINKSLLTLGTVINKLSEGALVSGAHIPYRDSKLTRILQPSLGGNAKTAIICAMTPALCHVEETHSTLRFACRAKRVVNNAVVNEVLSDAAVLKRQAKEIEELKKRLTNSGVGAHVEEQINHLRAQLLRSDQEKQLAEMKWKEESALREKAQKEAEIAKAIAFNTRQEPSEGPGRKQNRRETWCPGKTAWAAPTNLAAANDTPTHSGGGESAQRKRGLERLDSGAPTKSNAGLSTLQEEDEEDGEVAEGPTPQRRRRERSVVMEGLLEEDEEQQEQEMMRPELERIMAALPSQERAALAELVQDWLEMEERMAALQQELLATQQTTVQHEETARSASEARDTLAEQLEQVKWQSRQLDKKVEELTVACRSAEKEREELLTSHAQLQDAAASKHDELNTRHKVLAEAHSEMKDKLKEMKAELSDARAKLQLRDSEAAMREAKLAEHAQEVEEINAKLKERTDELNSMRRSLEDADERKAEIEGRVRELYECNKRLEQHVSELESRKRAPLYQKKQEEELKAAVEKSQECELRAVEAELRVKEMRAELEAAQKQLTELQESVDAKTRQAARAQEELAERHALELQRLNVESVLRQERHEEAIASAHAATQDAEAAKAALEQTLEAQMQRISELQQDAANLQSRITELQASEAELLACSTAAREKVLLLEHNAEEESAAHEAALAAAQRAHEEAMAAAVAAHEQAKAALQLELDEAKASSAATVKQLEEDLRCAQERADQLVKASLDQSQQAEVAKAVLERQVNELSAKVQEAAGALKAKEELKEERQRSKQEIASLKAELQKLQVESKTGAKGKDIAQKEIESLKKRLTDTETKLRGALQDKAAALQEKGNLERQLKQNQSQKLIVEKTLEKKDAVESKKRESIMVKSKEQLNSFEERLKQASLDLQRVQMDLMAKQSECCGLEQQLKQQQDDNVQLQEENTKLSSDLEELRKENGELLTQAAELNCKLEFATDSMESAKAEAQQLAADLERLQAELLDARSDVQQRDLQLEALRGEHGKEVAHHGMTREQLERLQSENSVTQQKLQQLETQCGALQGTVTELRTALDAVHAAAAAAEEARAAVEEAAQRARNEASELRNALSASEEQERALSAKHTVAQGALAASQQQLLEATTAHASVVGQLEAMGATCTALQAQLQQAVSSQEQLASRLSTAEAEVQRLTEQVRAADAEALQQSSRLEQAIAEAQRLLTGLNAAELEVKQLTGMLSAVQTEAQELAARAASAEQEAEQSRSQLWEANSETQRLSTKLAAAEFELRRLETISARASAASADRDEAVEQLAAQLASAGADMQLLREQVTQEQQAAATAAQLAARDLANAKAEAHGLRDQIAAVEHASLAGSEHVAVRLAEMEMEVQQLRQQLETALHVAADFREQAAAAAERVAGLSAQISSLESQLWHTRGQHATGIPAATRDDDTTGLLSSPAPNAAQSDAQSLPSAIRESFEKLLDESAAEIAGLRAALTAAVQRADGSAAEVAELRAALTAAVQRNDILQEELATARAQVTEAQNAASLMNVTTDITRSFATAGGSRRQVAELLQDVNQLAQENKDLEFRLDEVRTAVAAEQVQLRAAAEAAQSELVQRSQQLAELQQRCAGLEEALAMARQNPGNAQPQTAGDQNDNGSPGQGTDERLALLQERGAITAQLADALAAKEELAHEVLHVSTERERLQALVDELKSHVASALQQVDDHKEKLRCASQDAEQLAVTRHAYLELQGISDGQAAKLRELGTLQLHFKELQQQHATLHEQHAQAQRQLSELRRVQVVRAPGSSNPEDGVEAASDSDDLRLRIAELLDRQRELEAEMSDLQAACNVAVAEKHTLEQSMSHRVLQLETAKIRLEDELAKLRGKEPGGSVALPESVRDALDIDTLVAERDRLHGHIQELTTALDNVIIAKEQACARLEAELEAIRGASADMEGTIASLRQTQQALEADKSHAQEKIGMLQEALNATAATRAAADQDASVRAAETEAALSSLQSRFDELLRVHEELQKEAAAKSADADALRVGIAQELETRKEAERRGAELAGVVEDLRRELRHTQQTVNDLAANRSEASQRLVESEGAHSQVQQLQLQVSSLQASVARLNQELAAAKAAAAETEAEAQELLDANTMLECQIRDLRESHAALQSRAASWSEQSEAAAALATRLRESETLRSKLEVQVQELTQQVSTASERRAASEHERAELGNALAAAADTRMHLEQEIAKLDQAYSALRAENCSLEDALQAAQAKLVATSERPTTEQLLELESQLQQQEHRHRLSIEQHQIELATLQQRLANEHQAAAEREAALLQQLAALDGELGRLREAQVEAIDEVLLSAKQREAELNAEKLSLESQIHWLQEQVQRQGQQGAAPSAPQAHVAERMSALEAELRKAKRGEMKLQAMMFRIRKDVEAANGDLAAYDQLVDGRSLQYDVDMWTQKYERLARKAERMEAEKRQLHALVERQEQQLSVLQAGGSKAPMQPTGSSGMGVFVDKENMPYR